MHIWLDETKRIAYNKAMMETLPVAEKTTPTEKPTNAERYSNLVIKAEAKAREFSNRLDLNPIEAKRLAEIQADMGTPIHP